MIELPAADRCRYDLVSLGEVLWRLDPRDVPLARVRDSMRVFQGGGETNVACGVSATFGLRTAVLTALVADDIGRNIGNQLAEAGVDTGRIIWWDTARSSDSHSTDAKGTVHNGISVTFAGKGVLPSETLYYRAHTAASLLAPGDFDLQALFAREGVRVFNTGGIFTLIGDRTAQTAIAAAEAARAAGTFVAADLNYRSKVEPDRERARRINRRLIPSIDFLVGNDSDLSDALGYDTPDGDDRFEPWLERYRATIERVAADFPGLRLIGTQWRGAHDADLVSWGAVLYETATRRWYAAPVRERVHIADRTGGGDSFTAGVVSALLRGKDLQQAVEWGAAHGILVQSTPGDTTMVRQEQVIAEAERVRRGGGVKAAR